MTGSARKPSDRAGSWGSGTGTAGPSRPITSTAARPSYRAGSADTARDRITYREDEEERYSFSSRLVGQTTPKRTNSLDSPGRAPGREWEDKGPRSAERRLDNGGMRRGLDVTRPGPGSARVQLAASPSHMLQISVALLQHSSHASELLDITLKVSDVLLQRPLHHFVQPG